MSNPDQPNAEVARAIYNGNAAPEPLPERAGAFYSADPASSVVQRRSAELYTQTGMNDVQRRQLQDDMRGIARHVGDDAVAEQIATAYVDGLLADARVRDDPDADETTRAQRIVAGSTEIREHLIQQYGPKDGPALLERTQRFVRASPTLAKFMQQYGLGSRPDIVEGLAARVFSLGWR